MSKVPGEPAKTLTAAVVVAILWVIAFSVRFHTQDLPNNTRDPDQPLTRPDVWRVLFVEATSLFNPLDYTVPETDSGWRYLPQRLPFLAVAAAVLFCAWLCGGALLQLLRLPRPGLRSERIVLQCGSGLSVFSIWVLLIGCVGWLNSAALLALPACTGIVRGAILIRSRNSTAQSAQTAEGLEVSASEPMSPVWRTVLIVLLALFAVHLMLGGATPPRDFDVREYHLQGPREWFQAGQISTLEHNVYTSFPFLSEMLSLACMILTGDWWEGAMAGKLTLACFQILTTIAVYAMARRWGGACSGLIAALACLSTPWILRISIIAYAEGAIAFYLIASLMTAQLAVSLRMADDRRRMVALTGFLAGSAMASKYPGLVSVIIPVGVFFAVTFGRTLSCPEEESRAKEFLRAAVVFAISLFVAVGPWLIKNFAATGNPVYPLGYSVFGASDWDAVMDAKWKRAHSPSDHDLSRLPQHVNDVASRSDWQSGLLFALAVPAVFLFGRDRRIRWLWLYVFWMLGTWWALTHRIDRFWVPVIPVVAVLAGMAWRLSQHAAWRTIVVAAILLNCTYNYGFSRLPLVGFHGGMIELGELRQMPIRADFRQLNETLPEGSRVLMVGEAEVFDADFDLIYNTVFDESVFQQWTSRDLQSPDDVQVMKPAAEIAATLQAHGVTHVLVNWSEILRYRLTYGYTPYVQPAKFSLLVEDGVLQSPVVLLGRDIAGLSKDEHREVTSWEGRSDLFQSDFMATTVLYPVSVPSKPVSDATD